LPDIRIARAEDIPVLAPRLREADKNELKAASGLDPEPALQQSYDLSFECHSVTHDNEVIGMFGVAQHPHDPACGLCWGVSAPELMTTHKVWFIRNTGLILDLQHRHHPRLWGLIDTRNQLHMRWLKWSGFQFGRVFRAGPENRPFQEFWRHRDV
jgi:hypothetical protein